MGSDRPPSAAKPIGKGGGCRSHPFSSGFCCRKGPFRSQQSTISGPEASLSNPHYIPVNPVPGCTRCTRAPAIPGILGMPGSRPHPRFLSERAQYFSTSTSARTTRPTPNTSSKVYWEREVLLDAMQCKKGSAFKMRTSHARQLNVEMCCCQHRCRSCHDLTMHMRLDATLHADPACQSYERHLNQYVHRW